MPLAMERNCSNTSCIVYTQTWTSAPGAWVGYGKYCLSNLKPSALTPWLLVPRCTLGSAPFCPFLLRIFSFWRTEYLSPCPSLSERWFHLWLKDSGGMFPPLPGHATSLAMTQLDTADSWMRSRGSTNSKQGLLQPETEHRWNPELVSPVPGLLRKTPTRKQK